MARSGSSDVDVMLGNPRRAILAMAVPVTVAMLVQSLNNMIDAVWVSGLGTAALAATGVVFPLFFIMIGIGNGIGVGSSQAIARRIGAGDRDGASRVAVQAVLMTLVAGFAMAVVFGLAVRPLMAACGAGDYMEECVDYAFPLLVTAPVVLMSSLFSALLRSEGAARRSMVLQVVSAVINIVLDPIFIYTFGWGMAGAAWATVLSMVASTIIGAYWYFVRRDTYVAIPLRGSGFDRDMDRDILRVGLPASMEMILMSLTGIIMNQIIISVDPVNGVAIYSSGWRILNIAMIPVMAIGSTVVPICAAAFGMKDMAKLRDAFRYALGYGIIMMLAVAVLLAVFAPHVIVMFTYSDASSVLAPELTQFLRTCCLFLPFLPFGFVSSGFFQSQGMGVRSLIATLGRNLLRLPVCWMLSSYGVLGYLWYGLTFAEVAGSVAFGLWGIMTLRAILRYSGSYRRDEPVRDR